MSELSDLTSTLERILFTLEDMRREVTAVERTLAFVSYAMLWCKNAPGPDEITTQGEAEAMKNTEVMFHKLCRDFSRTRNDEEWQS